MEIYNQKAVEKITMKAVSIGCIFIALKTYCEVWLMVQVGLVQGIAPFWPFFIVTYGSYLAIGTAWFFLVVQKKSCGQN